MRGGGGKNVCEHELVEITGGLRGWVSIYKDGLIYSQHTNDRPICSICSSASASSLSCKARASSASASARWISKAIRSSSSRCNRSCNSIAAAWGRMRVIV